MAKPRECWIPFLCPFPSKSNPYSTRTCLACTYICMYTHTYIYAYNNDLIVAKGVIKWIESRFDSCPHFLNRTHRKGEVYIRGLSQYIPSYSGDEFLSSSNNSNNNELIEAVTPLNLQTIYICCIYALKPRKMCDDMSQKMVV